METTGSMFRLAGTMVLSLAVALSGTSAFAKGEQRPHVRTAPTAQQIAAAREAGTVRIRLATNKGYIVVEVDETKVQRLLRQPAFE